MAWDYQNGTVGIYLPGYVKNALHKFQNHTSPIKKHAPNAYSTPKYGATTQLTVPADTSDRIDGTDTKRLPEIVGTLLYYGRAVDITMLVALGTLAATTNTQDKSKSITHILN